VANSKRLLIALALVMVPLPVCATAPSDPTVCPPVVEHPQDFLFQVQQELYVLPEPSAIEEMLKDFQVMRGQCRARGPARISTRAAPAETPRTFEHSSFTSANVSPSCPHLVQTPTNFCPLPLGLVRTSE